MISLLEIPRRSQVCCLGKEVLVPGSDYYSVLLEDAEGQAYLRQDYCAACWELHKQVGAQPLTKSHWKGKVPHQQRIEPGVEGQDQHIFSLLQEALTIDNPASHMQAFVMALYLARKKKLVLRQEIKQPDKHLYLYEVIATEEMLAVPKVDLPLAELKNIQEELTKKLK